MIHIHTESEGNTLIIDASGKLTAKDYEDVFIPELKKLIGQFGKVRVVFHLTESFEGWEIGAAWDDAKFGLSHRNDFERVAMVGGPRWVTSISKITSHFLHVDLQTFSAGELDKAIAWAKA